MRPSVNGDSTEGVISFSKQRELIILVLGIAAGPLLLHALAQEVVGGVVGFEAFKDGFGSVDHGGGGPGEAGDLDAVRAVGRAFDHLADKDDVVVPFLDGDGVILKAVESLGQLGEFVIVGGEERAGAGGVFGM